MLHKVRLSDSYFAVEQADGSLRVLAPDEPGEQTMNRTTFLRAARNTGGVLLGRDGRMTVIPRKEGDDFCVNL